MKYIVLFHTEKKAFELVKIDVTVIDHNLGYKAAYNDFLLKNGLYSGQGYFSGYNQEKIRPVFELHYL